MEKINFLFHIPAVSVALWCLLARPENVSLPISIDDFQFNYSNIYAYCEK